VTRATGQERTGPSFVRRFVIPASFGLGVFLVLFRTYYASWYIENRCVHWLLTDVVGALYGVYVMFNVLFIYPWLVRRGARPAERVVGALLPTLFWCAKEVVRMADFFPLGQSLFFLLFPIHFNIVLMALGQMGICEVTSRIVEKRRGNAEVRVLTCLPVLAIVIMVLMAVFTNHDGGVSYFFLYNDLYRYLFIS
jgi:hypothetical protein